MLVKPILASAGVSLPVFLAGKTPILVFISLTLSPFESSFAPILELGSCDSPEESGLAVSLFCLFVDNHKGLLDSL